MPAPVCDYCFSWAFHAWDKNAKSYRVNGITASTTTREAGWGRMGFEYDGHCVWKTVYALFVRGLTEPLIGAVYTAKTMGVTLEIAPTGTRMFLPDGTIVPVDTSTGVTRCMHVKFGNGKDPKFGALRDTMNGKHVTFATGTDMTASRAPACCFTTLCAPTGRRRSRWTSWSCPWSSWCRSW